MPVAIVDTSVTSSSVFYKATSGGTVFTAVSGTTFDYFDNTAVVNDAFYIGSSLYSMSKATVTVGTALAGTSVVGVWEYFGDPTDSGSNTWNSIVSFKDDTNGFTTTGANSLFFGLPWGWKMSTTIAGRSTQTLWIRYRIVSVGYTIGAVSFTGTGLNDATSGGTYVKVGTENSATYEVEIDATGTPDTFKWRKGTGAWTTGVAITGAAQTLSDGVTITFAATTGHTLADKWTITVTSITEGGANATTAPTVFRQVVTLTSYTDASPCRLADIDSWLTTNASYLAKRRSWKYYDFREIEFNIASRLMVDQEETFEFGFAGPANSFLNGYYTLDYLQMGRLVGTQSGYRGGTMIVQITQNAWSGSVGANAVFYGSRIISPRGWGYPQALGKFYGCFIDKVSFIPRDTCEINNCLFNVGGTIIASLGWFGTFNDNKIVIPDTGFRSLGLLYSAGFEIYSPLIEFATSSANYILYLYNTAPNSTIQWNIINPATNLPLQTAGANWTAVRYNFTNGIGHAPDKVWFYDDSAGTYTDYTTEATNATTGDVPLFGDVGDCLIIGKNDADYAYGVALRFVSTLGGTNDYEYAFEDLLTAGWVTAEYVWDDTANFTKTGNIWRSKGTTGTTASAAVNGYTARWSRIRITKKGTGSPAINSINCRGVYGVGLWQINEKYTLKLKAQTEDGTAIEGATVTVTNATYGTKTGTTDSAGLARIDNVRNGTFDNSLEWVLGTGWTIASNKLEHTGAWSVATQNYTIAKGASYTLDFDFVGTGTLYIYFGSVSVYTTTGGTGHKTITITNAGSNGQLYFGSSSTCSISNVVCAGTELPVIYNQFYFDPSMDTTANGTNRINSRYFGNYTITITAAGYETSQFVLPMSSQTYEVITLKKALPVLTSTDGRVAVKMDARNIGVNRDKVVIV